MTNMITQIIPADHYKTRKHFHKDGKNFLRISEFYCDTIQGEGPNIGVPATFMRLQGCTLKCDYCDTAGVWNYGTAWTFDELHDMIQEHNLVSKFLEGQHLVFTGGSPLLQQDKIVSFIEFFYNLYRFCPIIEIENECMIQPLPDIIPYIDTWNNSPKLANSGIPFKQRYNALAIVTVATLPNSFFKFVIDGEEDWEEIKANFIDTGYVDKQQIILMPMAQTREELFLIREKIVEIAVKHNVRYSSREHIALWDKKIGV